MVSTPSSRALASFEPASAPATSRSVFFEIEPETFAPRPLGHGLGLVAGHALQRAGENHGLAGDRAVALHRLHRKSPHLRQQRVQRRLVMRLHEEIGHGLGHDLADPVDGDQSFARLAAGLRAARRFAQGVESFRTPAPA